MLSCLIGGSPLTFLKRFVFYFDLASVVCMLLSYYVECSLISNVVFYNYCGECSGRDSAYHLYNHSGSE